MLKVFGFLTKREGVESRAFIDYYENNHVPLVLSLAPTPTVYKRNYLIRDDEFNREDDTIDFDVMTELVFTDRATFVDPDFEIDFSRAVGPVQDVFKLDQTRDLIEELFGMWEAVRMEIDELREVGDHVAASITNYLRGRDGIELTARTPWVWTFRDGSMVRQCVYQEWPEALEAVGLSE